jgi:NADPH:quinone reductase-like Zn-dependent oxidoreductase
MSSDHLRNAPASYCSADETWHFVIEAVGVRAVTYDRYGGPENLKFNEVDRPALKDNGLLIRVHAVSLNRSDWENLVGSPAYVRFGGLFKPGATIPGSDIAGTVEAVGRDVTRFQVGDEVFGDILYAGSGGLGEYVAVPETTPLALKPPTMSFETAASLPQAGLLAVQGMRSRGGVQPGQKVLVNGAGGGGGTFTVQVAKSLGATVTGVDSAIKLDLLRTVGADEVIDYKADDYTKGPDKYDRILDFVGSRSVFANRRALAKDGVYQVVGGPARRLLQVLLVGGLISKLGSKYLGVLIARPNSSDLEDLAAEVVAGRITPVIDRVFAFEEASEAMRRLGEERSLGKIVIRVKR